ncbi:MAG: hypothetical protein ACOYO1_02510 [Bacteroidales bacterium]
MDFNFWTSPLIKNFEAGKLPVIETEVSFSRDTIIILTIAIVVIIASIVAAKKLSV